jgi:hypothetical protein
MGSPAFESRVEHVTDRWAKKHGLDVNALAEAPGQVSTKAADTNQCLDRDGVISEGMW